MNMSIMVKNILLSVLSGMLLLALINSSSASEITTINVSAQFKCNLLSKYMKKHGYSYIDEIAGERTVKTNIFAAKDAEVVVKNKYDDILAVGRTDKLGNYSVNLPRDNNYKIAVGFHNRQVEGIISYMDSNFLADLGYFGTEKVGSWIAMPALSYCYTCNIRYLEKKESF